MRMWRRRQPVALAAFIIAVLPSHAEALGKPISAIPSSQTRPTTSERVSALLAGIPERGNELGNTNAPVTLQYFADLECPFCKQFDLKVIPALIRRYVRTGKLRIEFRAFETSTREPVIFYTQQVAALAAGRQEKLWYFVELFFHEQREDGSGYVTENYLRGLAEQVPGLQLSQWEIDRSDRSLATQVRHDERAAFRAGFTGTPSVLIGRTGRKLHRPESYSLTDPTELEQEVRHLLRSVSRGSPPRSSSGRSSRRTASDRPPAPAPPRAAGGPTRSRL